MQSVAETIHNQVLKVAETVEQKLDEELQRLDELDSDGIEKLRQERLEQLKKQAKQKQLWLAIVSTVFRISHIYVNVKKSLLPFIYNK